MAIAAPDFCDRTFCGVLAAIDATVDRQHLGKLLERGELRSPQFPRPDIELAPPRDHLLPIWRCLMKGFAPTSAPTVTGHSNTRSECQSPPELSFSPKKNGIQLSQGIQVSVDYLVIATKHSSHDDLQAMVDFIAGFSNDEFFLEFDNSFSPGKGCKKYQNSGSSVKGCRLGWNVVDDISTTWLAIPGYVLSQMTVRDVYRLCNGLRHRWKASCRRFDIALDDYKRRVSLNEILRACEDGDIALVETYMPFGKAKVGEKFVPTVYLGSRESEKLVRAYDAWLKHGIDCIRLEAELKRRHAEEAFEHFTSSIFDPEDDESFEQVTAQYLGGLVIGAVDFVKYEEGVRYSRRKRLDWWASLCDEVGVGIRLSPARPKPTLERTKQWLDRSVFPSLAMFFDGLGRTHFNSYISGGVAAGRKRYSKRHEAIVKLLKGETAALSVA